MTITSALILFALTWFMAFFIIIQVNTKTQEESDEEIVAGTSASAPSGEHVKRYALWATLITFPLWGLEIWILQSGLLTLEMFDFYGVVSD